MDNTQDRSITVKECRDLRACMMDITSGCFLLKSEYDQILQIIQTAVYRELNQPAT